MRRMYAVLYSRVRHDPLHMLETVFPREHLCHGLPTCAGVSEALIKRRFIN